MVKSYEEGLRDGKIQAQEQMLASHAERLDAHSERILRLEKALWAVCGILALIEFAPGIKNFFMATSLVQ